MTGILLDIDGTLIDSNEAHARAWMEALEEAGIPADYSEIRAKIGEGGDRLLPQVTGIASESELGQRLAGRRDEIFRLDYLPKLRSFAGTRSLLELFRDRGFRYAAATSGSRRDAEALLIQARLDDLIDELVTGDDAAASKPAPDILTLALARLGLSAKDAVMLGDTPYDIEAARRAGMPAVAFTCGGWSREALKGAMAVYQGPWELLAVFDHSPFARRKVAA